MTAKKFKYAVFVGRFAPFHKGHNTVVEAAMDQAENLIMIFGSANKALDTRDPFSLDERKEIARAGIDQNHFNRVIMASVEDYTYNDERWIAEIQRIVRRETGGIGNDEIVLIGMSKDESSYYLKKFPMWKSINVIQKHPLNATDVREIMFEERLNDIPFCVSEQYFTSFYHYSTFKIIAEKVKERHQYSYDFEKEYPTKWGKGPHNTVDALVVQSGHILLIRRGKEYGHGLWALPGGFLNVDETTQQGMIRELYEETQIKVPEKVIKGSIVKRELFDAPKRDLRSRLITTVYHVKLEDMLELPKVKGSDDAMYAAWIPLSAVRAMKPHFFMDHYHIIATMLGL